MKPLREQLRDVEEYSYRSSVRAVDLVRQNYVKVIARKTKEFEQKLRLIEKCEVKQND